MAAIVFPPHSVPGRNARRNVFPVPTSTPRRVPVSHPRGATTPWGAPTLRPRSHAPALGPGGVPVAVYRRRRVAVGVAAAVVAALAYVLVTMLVGRVATAGAGVTRPAPPAAVATAPSTGAVVTYTVRPGDSLWSIARRLQPTGDIRPLVDQLAERNGGAALQIGQRLDLSGVDLGDGGQGGLDGLGR